MTQALTGQPVFAIDGGYVQPLSVVLVSLWRRIVPVALVLTLSSSTSIWRAGTDCN
jgi:hypothetical protein